MLSPDSRWNGGAAAAIFVAVLVVGRLFYVNVIQGEQAAGYHADYCAAQKARIATVESKYPAGSEAAELKDIYASTC